MIRINLLPVREAATKSKGKQIITLFVVLLLIEGGALFYYQSDQQAQLTSLRNKNNEIDAEIKKLKDKTKAVATLEAEKVELERQKTVLDGLIEGQSGPVRMLDELARMLTPVDDPAEKLRVQNLGWNPDWDPKRLWIESFVEGGRKVRIFGVGRSNEDVAEFLHRLESSRHFLGINLNFSEVIKVAELNNADLVRFSIEALAIYGPADVKKFLSGAFEDEKSKKKKKKG